MIKVYINSLDRKMSISDKVNISIIVPIYNVQQYLDCCLQSVANQTFKDFECILINDGSTDDSGKIADDWSLKDNRFRVIHQCNSGVSAARNKGIEESCGEWITFIDSDDWVEPDYLKKLVFSSKDSDYCIAGYKLLKGDKYTDYIPGLIKCLKINEIELDVWSELVEKYLIFGPCHKFYRKKIIADYGITFPTNVSYGEDLIFNFYYLRNCRTLSSVPAAIYSYNKHSNSLSSSSQSSDWNLNISQWRLIVEFYSVKGLFRDALKTTLYNRLVGLIYDSIFSIKFTSFNRCYGEIRSILCIPEVKTVAFKKCVDEYSCSQWIKFCFKFGFIWPLALKVYKSK